MVWIIIINEKNLSRNIPNIDIDCGSDDDVKFLRRISQTLKFYSNQGYSDHGNVSDRKTDLKREPSEHIKWKQQKGDFVDGNECNNNACRNAYLKYFKDKI